MIDWRKFQGIWEAVGLEDNGRLRPAEEVHRLRVTVAGNRYTLNLRSHRFQGVITQIAPTKKPKTVDFLGTGGLDSAGKKFLGIYVVEDDELTVCVAPPGKERPTSFDLEPGSHYWLYLLRRVNSDSNVGNPDTESRQETSPPAHLSRV